MSSDCACLHLEPLPAAPPPDWWRKAAGLGGLVVSVTRGEGLARLISRAETVFSISVETEVLTVTWCHTTTLWPCFLSPADLLHRPTPPSTPRTATPTTSTNMTRTPTSSSTQASPRSSELEEGPGPRHTGPHSSRGPAGTTSGVWRPGPQVTLLPPPRPPVSQASTPPPADLSRRPAPPRPQTTACPPSTTTNLPCPPLPRPRPRAQSFTTRRSQPPAQSWACPPVPQCPGEPGPLLTSA